LNISPSWLSLVLPGIALLAFSGGLLLRGLGQGALQSRLQGGETFAFVLGQQRGEERRQVGEGAGRQRLLPTLLGVVQARLQLLITDCP